MMGAKLKDALLSCEKRPYIAYDERGGKGIGLMNRLVLARVAYLWNP